jgi:hypothetical protein
MAKSKLALSVHRQLLVDADAPMRIGSGALAVVTALVTDGIARSP